MKILIASQTYNRKANGQGVFVVQLAEGLAQTGHEVMVLTPSSNAGIDRRNGVQVAGIASISLRPFFPEIYITLFHARQIIRRINEFQPDIVHIHDHYPLCRLVAREAVQRDLPLVASNAFLPDNLTLNLGLFSRFRQVINPLLWWMVLSVLNQARLITSPTETAANILRKQRPRAPVRAISCGVDRSRFRYDPSTNVESIRRNFGLDPHKTTFLYLGRLDNEKRVDVLIRAFAQAHLPNAQLAIAGKGMYAARLQRLAEDLDMDGQVVFTGFVPGEDLARLYNSIDFYAMPGDTELQSLSTLEALACGRPVLAANARALPEIVKHKVDGYLFQAGDVDDAAHGIRWLAGQMQDWSKLSAAGQAIAAPHDLHNTIRQYEQLYREIARTENKSPITATWPQPARRSKERLNK